MAVVLDARNARWPEPTGSVVAFGLLLTALLAHIWFASASLPLGGPNISLTLAFVVLAGGQFLAGVWNRRGAGANSLADLARHDWMQVMPVFVVSALMPLWALVVYSANDTLDVVRLMKMALGIGVLLTVFVCVSSLRRACYMAFALIFATAVSSLYGIAVVLVGDPFLSLWLSVAQVAEEDLQDMLLFARNAGLSAHISTFGRQLAVGVPLTLAALLHLDFGSRRWARGIVATALFALLMTQMTGMLMNNTRSVLVSVTLVCLAIGVLAARSPRARRRLLVTVPLAVVWQFVFFNPTGALQDGAPAAVTDNDRAPIEGLTANDEGDIGHVFSDLRAGVEYEVQLRERYPRGFGQAGSRTAIADDQGEVTLSWRRGATDATGYQFRLRSASAADWTMWLDFEPSLGTANDVATIQDLAIGYVGAVTDANRRRIGHRFEIGPVPQRIRLRAGFVDRVGSATTLSLWPDQAGAAVLTWLVPDVLGITHYQYQLRAQDGGTWGEWQYFEPLLQHFASDGVELRGLLAGSGNLSIASEGGRVGHAFGGFVPWIWYVVQVRVRYADGTTRVGETTSKPDEGGNFALSWEALSDSADIVTCEFRTRDIAADEWLPWLPFTPSISSKVPVLAPARGSQAAWRHVLEGLVPKRDYRVQLRARNQHGYGGESAETTLVAGSNGNLALAWNQPEGQVDGHQFRLWWQHKDRWWPWQDFVAAPDGTGRTRVNLLGRARADDALLTAARTTHELAGGDLDFTMRFEGMLDATTRTRMHELATVWRYVTDHPFGAGVYAPTRAHVGDALPEWLEEELLRLWPHNQFLHILGLYGWPGLLLLVAFYAAVFRVQARCCRFALRANDASTRFLGVGVVAALAAYTINSLMIPTGPFIGGWSHFFLLGMLLAVERMSRRLANAS